MKLRLLASVALFTAINLLTPASVFSQPNRRTDSYAPGFWQPGGNIDPNLPVQFTLLNESGIPLKYGLNVGARGDRERVLPPGSTGDVFVRISNRTGDIASINIYPVSGESMLNFEYQVTGNSVKVRIQSGPGQRNGDRAVYLDEEGRVYSF
jgi:hypothetical protein